MSDLHIKAKTLDEAITEACLELGVTSDHLDYTVDVQGSNGFFGIGARQYEITARIKKEEPVPKKARVNSAVPSAGEKESGLQPKSDKTDTAASGDKSEDFKPKAVKKSNSQTAKFTDKKNERESVNSNPARTVPKERQNTQSGKRENRINKNRNSSDKQAVKAERQKNVQTDKNIIKDKKPFILAEDPSERAGNFLGSLFKSMDMKINYSGRYEEDSRSLIINLSGDDMGVLIGKRGQTLDALQYLTSQVVNKHQNGYIRVKIDTENYRERRKETLEQFALNMAEKVKINKRPMVLEPMNAYERRIIHSILQSEKDILTRSEGEEPYRHIVICPVKKKRCDKGNSESDKK